MVIEGEGEVGADYRPLFLYSISALLRRKSEASPTSLLERLAIILADRHQVNPRRILRAHPVRGNLADASGAMGCEWWWVRAGA